jgi:hypothetical protein
MHAYTAAGSAGVKARLLLSHIATQRNAAHRRSLDIPTTLNNRPTTHLPSQLKEEESEMSLNKALRRPDPEGKIAAACAKEMSKYITLYKVGRPIRHHTIEPTAELIRAAMRVKFKRDDTVRARLVLDGSGQSPHSYNSDEIAAGTSDNSDYFLMISAMYAEALSENKLRDLIHSDFDLPGAFLQSNLPRSATRGHQIVATLPKNLPHALAGTPLEILAAGYGLKQSNHIFTADRDVTMATAGFHPLKSNTSMYIRVDPQDPKRRTIVDMCVDDGQIISFAKDQVAELKATITKRYGEKEPITWNDVSTGYKGMQITRSPSGAVTYDVTKYTLGYLDRAGMDQVPAALTPSDPDFFDPPTDVTPFHDPATYAKRTHLHRRHQIRHQKGIWPPPKVHQRTHCE